MKPKFIMLACFVCLALSSCADVPQQRMLAAISNVDEAYKTYVPTEPLTPEHVSEKVVSADISGASAKQILARLPVSQWVTTISKMDDKGNLSYIVASASLEKGTYRLVYEFVRYIDAALVDPVSHREYGMGRVGVGLRVVADVQTSKSGVDLGSLLKLGVAASTESASGNLIVKTMGITLANPSLANFTAAKIDEDSIMRIYESAGAVTAKLGDADTILTPMILYAKLYPPPVAPSNTGQ